jgi:putative transposase
MEPASQCPGRAKTFFKTVKSELFWRAVFNTRDQATVMMGNYIDQLFNPRRRHTVLDFTSAIQYVMIVTA